MKPAKGDVLALGNRNAERLFHLVDVGLSVDEPAVLTNANDCRLFVFVELVIQIADQLFEDVADRHDARDAAVLVEDERERPTLLSHLTETLKRSIVSGNMNGRRILRAISVAVGSETPIARLAVVLRNRSFTKRTPSTSSRSPLTTGKTGVTGVANRFGDHFGRHRRVRKNDVGARVITSRSSSSLSW